MKKRTIKIPADLEAKKGESDDIEKSFCRVDRAFEESPRKRASSRCDERSGRAHLAIGKAISANNGPDGGVVSTLFMCLPLPIAELQYIDGRWVRSTFWQIVGFS